jgi:hypothetical protein
VVAVQDLHTAAVLEQVAIEHLLAAVLYQLQHKRTQ